MNVGYSKIIYSGDMMIKAFLSHHSADKAIVEAVANKLTRAQCIFDKFTFKTGDNLNIIIQERLSEATIFVLFLGSSTMSRPYVQLELKIAKELYDKGIIKSTLMFCLDDYALPYAPKWLTEEVYESSTDPDHIAHVIQNKIDKFTAPSTNLLIGRDLESSEMESLLVDRNKKQNIIFLSGLDGIGRRTFATFTLKSKLGFYDPLLIEIAPLDTSVEILLRIAEKRERLLTDIIPDWSTLKTKSEDMINALLIKILQKAQSQFEPVIFVDKGGIFNQSDSTNPAINNFLNALIDVENLPVFITTYRRPPFEENFKHLHLKALTRQASDLLFQRLIPEIQFDANLLQNLYYKTGGHPATVKYAALLLQRYGISGKEQFIDKLQYEIFSSYLQELALGETERIFLALLYRYNPLPIDIACDYLNSDIKVLSSIIERLIDWCVIECIDYNLYEIAHPLLFSISKLLLDDISAIDHEKIKFSINKSLNMDPDRERNLALLHLLGRAKLFTNDSDIQLADLFPSDIFKQVKIYYHDKDYKNAIELATKLLALYPEAFEVYEFLIKSYIREDKFINARDELNKYKSIAPPRAYHFLNGFMKRHEGKFEEALAHYRLAMENGFSNVSIFREQAQCYIQLREYESALEYAHKAFEHQDRNVFVLDIYADALARNNKFDEAREQIKRMLELQPSEFTYQRAAAYEWAYGDLIKAKSYMVQAIKLSGKHLVFEIFSLSALISIELGEIDSARYCYGNMQTSFPDKRSEIQNAILMAIYTVEGNYEAASLLYKKLKYSKLIAVENIIARLNSKFNLEQKLSEDDFL